MTRSNELKKRATPERKRAPQASGTSGRNRKHVRNAIEQEDAERFWMRCPRCGLGLIESLSGPVKMERCTACARIWFRQQDVVKISEWDTTGLFRPFREK